MSYRTFLNMLITSLEIRVKNLKEINNRIDSDKDIDEIEYLQYYNGISDVAWDTLDKLINYIDEDCHEGSIYKIDKIL